MKLKLPEEFEKMKNFSRLKLEINIFNKKTYLWTQFIDNENNIIGYAIIKCERKKEQKNNIGDDGMPEWFKKWSEMEFKPFKNEINNKISNIEKDIATLKADVKEIKNEQSIMKKDIATLKADVIEIKNEQSIMKKDIATLKADVIEIKKEQSIMKKDIATLKADVIEIKNEQSIMKKDIATLKEDVIEIKNEQFIMKNDIIIIKNCPTVKREISPK